MPHAISRDGKHRRPRKGDPLFFLDSRGRRHVVPSLDKIILKYEWSKFNNRRMQFCFTWRDKTFEVFDSFAKLEAYQRDSLILNAAVVFCQKELEMGDKVFVLRNHSVVKTIYRRWLGQIGAWALVLDEAAGMLAMSHVMES